MYPLLHYSKELFCNERRQPRPRSFTISSCQMFGYFAHFTTVTSNNFWTRAFCHPMFSFVFMYSSIRNRKHLFHCLFVCFCFVQIQSSSASNSRDPLFLTSYIVFIVSSLIFHRFYNFEFEFTFSNFQFYFQTLKRSYEIWIIKWSTRV